MKTQQYTLSVLTENHVGLTHQVMTVFTRRKLNVNSLSASETENKDIYRFTIVINTTEEMIKKVVKALEKQLEVIKALVYTDDELVWQELALYKVPTQALLADDQIERIVRANNARILSVSHDYTIIEKTGHKEKTQELFELLKPFGILGFTRTGRIALTKKPMIEVNNFLSQFIQEKEVSFV